MSQSYDRPADYEPRGNSAGQVWRKVERDAHRMLTPQRLLFPGRRRETEMTGAHWRRWPGWPVACKHDFACHTSLAEQLVRLSGLAEREALSDERLDPLLLKEVEQDGQILSKPCRFYP